MSWNQSKRNHPESTSQVIEKTSKWIGYLSRFIRKDNEEKYTDTTVLKQFSVI